MILYHGSNIEVKNPQIIKSRKLLDFGAGFYLTSDYGQARKWAVRTTDRRREGNPVISAYHVNSKDFESLSLLVFDQAIRTINDFLKGRFTEDIAIQLLLPQNLKDQYAFKTEKAISILELVEVKYL